MKTKTLHDELLSTIDLDPIIHVVVDDLSSLECLVPAAPTEVEALAIFRQQTHDLLGLRGRSEAHTEQVRRLIGLIAREPHQVEIWIDAANALTILTNAANLGLLLLPARSDDDVWARDQFAYHLLRHAQRNGDGEDIALARRAVGELPRQPMHLSLPEGAEAIKVMIETMARRVGALQSKLLVGNAPGKPGLHPLEQADSLKAYFKAAPDLAGLFDSAQTTLALVDELRGITEPDAVTLAAIEGGLILAYARLIRIALWPARNSNDVGTKIAARDLVRSRNADPARFGALWEIAFDQGETVAGQSSRFLNVDDLC